MGTKEFVMKKTLLDSLRWNRSPKEQLEDVVRLALDENTDPSTLIMPALDKQYWGNAALTLLLMEPERVKPYLPQLMIWLQDANWPGAYTIMEMLHNMPKEYVMPALQAAREEALKQDDENWVDNIDMIYDTESITYIRAYNHIIRTH